MSEATEAASQLGSPRQIAAHVPMHTEGHGPDEQRRVIEEDLMQCFFIMEQNWKIFFAKGLRKASTATWTSTHSHFLP